MTRRSLSLSKHSPQCPPRLRPDVPRALRGCSAECYGLQARASFLGTSDGSSKLARRLPSLRGKSPAVDGADGELSAVQMRNRPRPSSRGAASAGPGSVSCRAGGTGTRVPEGISFCSVPARHRSHVQRLEPCHLWAPKVVNHMSSFSERNVSWANDRNKTADSECG